MSEHKKIYANSKSSIYWYRQGHKDQLNGKQSNLIGNDLFLDVSDNSISMGKKHLWHLNGQKKI